MTLKHSAVLTVILFAVICSMKNLVLVTIRMMNNGKIGKVSNIFLAFGGNSLKDSCNAILDDARIFLTDTFEWISSAGVESYHFKSKLAHGSNRI